MFVESSGSCVDIGSFAIFNRVDNTDWFSSGRPEARTKHEAEKCVSMKCDYISLCARSRNLLIQNFDFFYEKYKLEKDLIEKDSKCSFNVQQFIALTTVNGRC